MLGNLGGASISLGGDNNDVHNTSSNEGESQVPIVDHKAASGTTILV